MRRFGSLARSTSVAAVAVAALVVLAIVRPSWPLHGSLWSPLTTEEVEGIVRAGGWLIAVVVALMALGRALHALRQRPDPRSSGRLPAVIPTPRPARPRRDSGARIASGFALTIPAPTPRSGDKQEQPSVPSDPAPVAGDEARLSVGVLGPLSIDGLNRRLRRAATRELVAYLALHPKGASRDELVEAIWPAQDPARTRPRFWQSVTEARKALGDAWVHEGERYELDRSKVRVDVDQLDALLASADVPDALERALALWRGEPLEGSDYLWAEGEVRSLRATLLDLLERVGRLRLDRRDPRGALQLAERAIALDRLHEASWRLALQAEHALGLRESITRRYDELRVTLDEELGLEPARETRAILRELLAQA